MITLKMVVMGMGMLSSSLAQNHILIYQRATFKASFTESENFTSVEGLKPVDRLSPSHHKQR